MNKFLALYKDPPVRTLSELVQFNKDHASVALPPSTHNPQSPPEND